MVFNPAVIFAVYHGILPTVFQIADLEAELIWVWSTVWSTQHSVSSTDTIVPVPQSLRIWYSWKCVPDVVVWRLLDDVG
jgi:hypothetical protein